METKHNTTNKKLTDQQQKQPQGTADNRNRAELDGKKGKFESEELKKTGTSAIPGAESKEDIGNVASGAGLGGNKGTGTRNK